MEENYFKKFYDIDFRDKTRQKNGLNYISWAAAWAEAKKYDPNATYKIYKDSYEVTKSIVGESPNEDNAPPIETITRTIEKPWFDDGKTGWVQTGVTINGIEHIDVLPILNLRNQPIKAEDITSSDANRSIQRSLTRACARHGIALYVYEGEDLPQELREVEQLQADCLATIKKKCALSDKTSDKVGEVCREVLGTESGNPSECDDAEVLRTLKKKLLAIRKIV